MYKAGITIWYNVNDLEQTLQFYTEGLGFELEYKDEEQKFAIVATSTKDCSIGLAEAETVEPVTSSTVFEVENIEQAVAELKARGVNFTGDIETIPDFVKLATFNDPDGHCFELSQTLVAS